MPLPKFHKGDWDIEGVVEHQIGPFLIWVVYFENWAQGSMIAFRYDGGMTWIREAPRPDDEEFLEMLEYVPGHRLGTVLSEHDFVKRWEAESDPHLYPQRKGKLKRHWPDFSPDMPLGVLADWLQEHGMERAAEALRKAEEVS